jgi:hypothetical protein
MKAFIYKLYDVMDENHTAQYVGRTVSLKDCLRTREIGNGWVSKWVRSLVKNGSYMAYSVLEVVELEDLNERWEYWNKTLKPKISILQNGGVEKSEQEPRQKTFREKMEKLELEATLCALKWNIQQVAKRLGLSRVTVYARIKKYGLQREGEGVDQTGSV